MSQKLTSTETTCTIDFRKQQVNARPELAGYYSAHTELYEILGPERYKEYFEEKAKKPIRKKG